MVCDERLPGGLKLLFHLTLCNKVNIFLLWRLQLESNHWDEFSRCAEQETVAGDLDNHSSHDQHHRHTGYIRRKISTQKTGGHLRSSQTDGATWNIRPAMLVISGWIQITIEIEMLAACCDAAKKEQISQPWISQVENHGRHPLFRIECVFIDIFNFPPICCFINEPVAVWFIGYEFSVSSFSWVLIHTWASFDFSPRHFLRGQRCQSLSWGRRSLQSPSPWLRMSLCHSRMVMMRMMEAAGGSASPGPSWSPLCSEPSGKKAENREEC